MYKYTITFTADTLDEGALRDILEERFRVYDSAVSRSKIGQVATAGVARAYASPRAEARAKDRSSILSLFEGGALVSPKTMKKAIPNLDNSTIQHELLKLCASGLLRKVGHGLYQSTAFPEPTEADVQAIRNSSRVRVTGNEDERLLDFLSIPREGTDIRFHLRVSRQRVDQKIKVYMDKGLVFREQIDGLRYLYCTDKRKLDTEMEGRRMQPSHSAKRIIAALPQGPCLVTDLAKFCGLSETAARVAGVELEARGLVETIGIGASKALILTRLGASSEFAQPESPKAPPSDLSAAYGDVRGDVIEVLAIMGEATSKELTMALRGLYPERGDVNMGQRVQRLRGEGLIVSMVREDKKHPAHRLSKKGEEVWSYIRSFRNSPSRAVVLEHVRNGVQELHSRSGVGGHWLPSERALSMMRAMDAMGALTQREIVELMDVRFDHPRSADLALSGLKDRGLVNRDGGGSPRSPYRWTLTDAGKEALSRS